jgi:hypothetical protein
MKNRLIPIIGLILLILMAYFIYRAVTKPEAVRLRTDLTEMKNTVINQSSIPYLDTLTQVGLEGLGVEGVVVTLLDISPIHQVNLLEGQVVNGFVTADSKTNLRLFLNPNLKEGSIITYLSHELVHVEQVYTGKLWVINSNTARWDGKIVNINDWTYLSRPWEVDAYRRQVRVSSYIYDRIYAYDK